MALGGSAYALKLTRNSVGSKQIKPNAVKGKDAKESSAGEVPTATNADNAAKLGGLASSAFQPNGAVVGGSGDPTVVSQTMLTIPDIGLQIETNGAATGTNDVIARNVGSQSLSFVFGNGAGDENTVSPSGTFGLFAGVNEFGERPLRSRCSCSGRTTRRCSSATSRRRLERSTSARRPRRRTDPRRGWGS